MHHDRRYPATSHRVPAAPSSVALDDQFDAMTTNVPTEFPTTEWNDEDDGRPEYEESVSGYRNYVTEMERMLGGEVDLQVAGRRSSDVSVATRRARRSSPEVVRSPGRSRLGMDQYGDEESVRQVSGRRASVELVEHRVIEDGPQRTISLWREKVARSSLSGTKVEEEVRSEAGSHTHRRMPSGESYRRVTEEYTRPKERESYERSEVRSSSSFLYPTCKRPSCIVHGGDAPTPGWWNSADLPPSI